MVQALSTPQAITIIVEDAEIWRYLGGHRSPSSVAQELASEFAWAKRRAAELMHPLAIGRFLKLERMEGNQVCLEGDLLLGEGTFARFFQSAEGAYLALVTIGMDLEKEVAQLAYQRQAIEALLLDAVGSAAAENAFKEVRRNLCQEVTSKGWKVGPSLQPGQHYWDISGQRAIYQAVKGEAAGISITEADSLVPFKSKSAAIPVGARLSEEDSAVGHYCHGCRLVNCIARIR